MINEIKLKCFDKEEYGIHEGKVYFHFVYYNESGEQSEIGWLSEKELYEAIKKYLKVGES